MATLEIDRVRKAYGSMEVLKEVSISIGSGDFLVLLGPSGCGKSTLLNMIAGLEGITAGQIRIDGDVVNDLSPKDRDIAMVFQSYALYPTMTVRQNIEFGMKIRGVPPAERDKATREAAELLQMAHLLDRRPSQLSGGQRQRVAMGRALVRHPKLFLFDEPLSNLDAKLRVDMRTEIKRLHQRLGTTIVYVTHDQIEAMTLATRVAVMKDGIVQHLDEPQVVYDRPANVYVARFVGSPAMNIIPGRLIEGAAGPELEMDQPDGGRSRISGVALSEAARRQYAGKPVLVGIRPEGFSVAEPGQQAVQAAIEVVEPTGPDTLAMFTLGGVEVIARLAPRTAQAGQTARLAVEMAKVVLFDPQTEIRID
ncbi:MULTISPECIES: ABC transporter ATP-binding protein [Paracoccus]|uniref:ABC transporter ATP-binding protein n=2 Tax=Paracoccus TaxID=265 RepID=A0AAE6NTD5_PARPN|nr:MULTISPECIES: ABC transporter ATP-binding protein [Paracoccus]MDF3856335.1 ABC transporter ATP-binding protein [Paracoccus pantotrophus]QFG34820.1 ABC transporter ATP-binding protein [Paracoccus pantotrophus]RKS43604.1 carbohydrate ABC transporter ATP-binding protein (CUT1 family) [Paracoccus pantotrophus]SFP11672.1 carbohydrate ABC transporter ATP-binding protein, CUT1 family [Paracoccus pantotrophus]SMG50053.1 carbohydrate ABC transporter ATP-binding protein, CUT1 family [Paracoccus sp. J